MPRLFVNHAMVGEGPIADHLSLMERKLYRFMTPLGVLGIGFGLWLWLGFGFGGGWMSIKLLLVLALIAYHGYCGKLLADFALGRNARSHIWYRWFNEIPVLILVAVVILVVVKPF